MSQRKKLLEREVEKAICDYVKSLGGLAYKFTSPRRRNVPDRLFILPGGSFLFIEMKATGKKPTEAQWREINRLKILGAPVYWTDNIETGKALVSLYG